MYGDLEVRVIRTVLRRTSLVAAAAALALQLVAAPAMAGPRLVTVGSDSDGVLTSSTVSAGESTTFTVTVKSNSTQKLQHTTLYVGQDSGSGVSTDLPVAYPAGLTAAATGCSTVDGILKCDIGTLGKQPFTFTIVLSSDNGTAAQTVTSKALVRVNEGTDSGPNNQAYDAYGDVTLKAFSCDAVTAYRANGSSKVVSTPCDLSSSNKQQSAVTLPGNLTTITLSEGSAVVACPSVSGLSCIGDGVFADITGDSTGDVVTWTIKYDVTGLKINTSKLVVYHYNDETGVLSPAGGISLAKSNACKASNPVNCGSATLTGNTLEITFKTNGNGKTRLLG
jgi:hypothetical protein